MSEKSRYFGLLLLFFVGFSVAPAAVAQTTDLALALVDARLESLRDDGAASTDEIIQAYEVARTRLNDAETFDRDTTRYVDALVSAPRLQAEIQARIDGFDGNENTAVEMPGLSSEELESRLALTRGELHDIQNFLDSYERRLKSRETESDSLRTRLNEISQRLGEIDEPALSIDPDAIPTMTEALRWGAAAEYMAVVAERRANKAQLDSHSVRYSVLQAQHAELALRADRLVGQVRTLQESLRRSLSDEAQPNDLGIDDDDSVYAIVKILVMENARLREQRLDTEERIDAVSAQEDAVTQSVRALRERFA